MASTPADPSSPSSFSPSTNNRVPTTRAEQMSVPPPPSPCHFEVLQISSPRKSSRDNNDGGFSLRAEARLGRLSIRHRAQQPPVETPHYVAVSSRGCVPHITPDMMRDSTAIRGVLAAFEDSAESPLRRFIALPKPVILILGPRRVPALPTPTPNYPTALSISASVGYRSMEIQYYIDAIRGFRPDIIVGPVDVEIGEDGEPKALGAKRKEKVGERSLAWMRATQDAMARDLEGDASAASEMTSLWAPILPMEEELQRSYLEHLEEQQEEQRPFGGVALYRADSAASIPSNMKDLPRLALTQPRTPHDILTSIALGVDLITVPFVTTVSEAGIAFAFSLSPDRRRSENAGKDKSANEYPTPRLLPLGVDLWPGEHATDLSPLLLGCACYTCKNHHRAYVRHLLNAKEMLAWVLLQVHNYHVLDCFFEDVRNSIGSGTFDDNMARFQAAYEPDFPEFKGQGPRIRGYQAAILEQKPPKRNKPPYRKLERKSSGAADKTNNVQTSMHDEGKEKLAEVVESEDLDLDGMYDQGDVK